MRLLAELATPLVESIEWEGASAPLDQEDVSLAAYFICATNQGSMNGRLLTFSRVLLSFLSTSASLVLI